MGDAGEGLVDAVDRVQDHRLEQDLTSSRRRERPAPPTDLVRHRTDESLRRARTELQRQAAGTPHVIRRRQIEDALADIERRLAATEG